MNQIVSSKKAQQRKELTVLTLLLIGYGLFILYPILRADRYCNDDLLRALSGNYGWNNNGRHLANLLMRTLQFNGQRLVDISPLPQLAAIGILAWTGVLIARRYAIASPWLAVLIAFPLGAQPFYLENLSYKFDAPCMALAMLCAVWPLLTVKRTHSAYLLGIASLLASLSLYQPAITVFLIFTILEFAVDQANKAELRPLLTQILLRAAQALIAVTVYRWLFEPAIKDWIRDHGTLASGSSVWPVISSNARAFSDFTMRAFHPRWIALFAPFAILAAALPVVIGLRQVFAYRDQRSMWQIVLLAVAITLLPMAAVLCAVGPMLLLVQPVLMPRVMLGIGALLCAALLAMNKALQKWPGSQRWQLANAGVWALGMVVYANAYANAAGAQKRYEDSIAMQIANDLAEVTVDRQSHYLLLSGSAGLAPVTMHAANQFPLIRSLVLPYLSENDFNSRNFLRFYIQGVEDLNASSSAPTDVESVLKTACATKPTHVRSAYALRLVGDIALICLSKQLSSSCQCGSALSSAPVADVQSLEQVKKLP